MSQHLLQTFEIRLRCNNYKDTHKTDDVNMTYNKCKQYNNSIFI